MASRTDSTPIMLAYKGYKLVSRMMDDGVGNVAVFESGAASRQGAVYSTTSLDLAMKWVDAYREGRNWAP